MSLTEESIYLLNNVNSLAEILHTNETIRANLSDVTKAVKSPSLCVCFFKFLTARRGFYSQIRQDKCIDEYEC